MSDYKRERVEDPIPVNLNEFLTIEQRIALNNIASFGWDLYFIRRPLFQEPIVIIRRMPDGDYKQIEPDGTIIKPNITIREVVVNES